MLTTNQYVNEIYRTMKEIAERVGVPMTRITKLTGFGSDTRSYEILHIVIKTNSDKSYDKVSTDEYARMLNTVNNIRLELDGLGHLLK